MNNPDKKSPPQGHTMPRVGGQHAPRLPHEHDESADSQTMEEPRPEMKQAHEDLRRGLVDTDRAAVVDEVYRRTTQPATTSAKPAKLRQ